MTKTHDDMAPIRSPGWGQRNGTQNEDPGLWSG